MRIHFECSGGITNVQLRYDKELQALPPELAEELAREIEAAGVFSDEFTPAPGPAHGPPDVMRYQLRISDDQRSRSIAVTDVTAPESLRPLLSRLYRLALQERMKSGSP